MADNPTSNAGNRDPYFAQQIQALQGQVAQLQQEVAALKAKVK